MVAQQHALLCIHTHPQENPRFIVIECLCKFLPQVGRLLEAQRDTKILNANKQPMSGKEVMFGYMGRIRKWIDNKVADMRLRFMLMVCDDDVYWAPCRDIILPS